MFISHLRQGLLVRNQPTVSDETGANTNRIQPLSKRSKEVSGDFQAASDKFCQFKEFFRQSAGGFSKIYCPDYPGKLRFLKSFIFFSNKRLSLMLNFPSHPDGQTSGNSGHQTWH
jgi:hypothetical protein